MVLIREKKVKKQLNLRKGWGIFVSTVLIFSTLVLFVHVQSVEGISGTYDEDFTTTTYMSSYGNNVSGWSSGTINLPLKITNASAYNTPGYAWDVFVNGNYAYVADGSGLQIVDISNPTDPINVSAYNTTSFAYNVFVSGDSYSNYAFIATESALLVVDVSNPLYPNYVGNYTDGGRGVFVDSNYAYVADWYGLKIIDISNPTNPTLAGSCDTPGEPYNVFISGEYAYVADRESGLQVIDIFDPTDPIIAGSYDTGIACDVFVSGDYAYVADWNSGLQVVDISDPANPTNTSVYSTYIQAQGVFVSGDYAYLANRLYGLQIVNISDPTILTYAGLYDVPGEAKGVFVSGDYAYVAYLGVSPHVGLQIVEVKQSQFASSAIAVSSSVKSLKSEETFTKFIRATLESSDSVPQDTSITYYLSADDGSHWEKVTQGEEHYFEDKGEELRWKAVLTSSDPSKTPRISSLSISYDTEEKWWETYLNPWFYVVLAIIGVFIIGVATVVKKGVKGGLKLFKKEEN